MTLNEYSRLMPICAPAGSIFFTFSSCAGLLQIIASHSMRSRLLVAYPYAFGSLLYTWGMYCSVVASAEVLRKIEVEQGRLSRSWASEAARGTPTEALRQKNATKHARYAQPLICEHALGREGLLDWRGCHVCREDMHEIAVQSSLRKEAELLQEEGGQPVIQGCEEVSICILLCR